MPKKRKILIVTLLLFVHALLLFHEVAVNRVLCYKNGGSVDLELALFDYRCFCKDSDSQCCEDDDHHSRWQPGTLPEIGEQSNTCWDLPFNGSWLERVITPGTEKIHFVKLCDLNIKINIQLDDAFRCFFDSLPLRKYLDRAPSELNSVILRC